MQQQRPLKVECQFYFILSYFQAQKKELDHIRQKYRKNSLARTPTTSLREENQSSQQQKSQKRIEEED